MKKLSLILLLLFAILVTACGPLQQEKPKSGEILYTVTDAQGERLSFYEKPRRIVSLNSSIDEILLDLVDNKRIVALSALADDESISCVAERAQVIPARASARNLEGILVLKPDLVLMPDYSAAAVQALRATGLPVYVVHTPQNMAGIFVYIEDVAKATGDVEAGQAMNAKMQARLEAVRAKVNASVPPEKQLKVLGMSFTGAIGAKGTFSELCHYAGVKNALEGVDIPYQSTLSDEEVLKLNPDMIITPSWDYSKQGDPEKFRERVLHNPLYKNLNAIKTGKVVRLHDKYLYSTSQFTVNAVEELAQAAYPELF